MDCVVHSQNKYKNKNNKTLRVDPQELVACWRPMRMKNNNAKNYQVRFRPWASETWECALGSALKRCRFRLYTWCVRYNIPRHQKGVDVGSSLCASRPSCPRLHAFFASRCDLIYLVGQCRLWRISNPTPMATEYWSTNSQHHGWLWPP